jgi:hypothetical protein
VRVSGYHQYQKRNPEDRSAPPALSLPPGVLRRVRASVAEDLLESPGGGGEISPRLKLSGFCA